MSWYFDSSAILKLILRENNYQSIAPYLNGDLYTSRLSRVEVFRTLAKREVRLNDQAERVFERYNLVEIKNSILRKAETFPSTISLASLDSIHVATALGIAPLIEGVITYDKNMVTNSEKLGLTAISPGE